ncbi:MAG: MFS transporter [Spirochaetaceae bacterium]|nr:MAG: MFS transporter [Spirochaetaceae bacterium]
MHKAHTDPAIDRKVRSSLRYSLLDGAAFSIMLGSAESYFQAFAVFLKATVAQVGIVYTIPMFVASLIQLHASSLLRWFRSRKNLTVLAGALRSLLFLPLILVYYMGVARVWVLLGIICLYFALNYLPIPAWTSWMRDLVDENRRGAYFSRRNRISNLVALLGIIFAGLILEYFKVRPSLGFFIIFGVAMVGSIGSTIFLSLKYDAPYSEPPQDREGFFRFSIQMFRSNYGRFVLYNFALYFGVFFAGPFFVPYMLKDLGFSYLQFMISTSLVVLVKFITLPLWGELGDRYGNKKILVLASLFISILPFLWIAHRAFWWICLIQVTGGLVWAGFDISALNFAYDVLPSEKVTRHTSYLIFYRGLAIFIGGLVGGLVFHHFRLFGSTYYGNFFLSGVIRVLIAVPLLFFLKEERTVEHISYHDLMFKLMSVGPRRGLQLFLIGKAKPNGKDIQESPKSD